MDVFVDIFSKQQSVSCTVRIFTSIVRNKLNVAKQKSVRNIDQVYAASQEESVSIQRIMFDTSSDSWNA